MNETGSKGLIGGTQAIANPFSGNGAANKARALGSIGAAIQSLGSEASDIIETLHGSKNAETEQTMLRELEEGVARIEGEIATEADPEKRFSKWSEKTSKLKDQVYQREYLPPDVRKRVDGQWAKIRHARNMKMLGQVASLNIEKTKAAFGQRLDLFTKNLDKQSGLDLINEAEFIPDHEKPKMREAFTEQINREKFEVLLDDEPKEAERRIPELFRSKVDRLRAKKKVETAILSLAQKEQDKLKEDLELGKINSETGLKSRLQKSSYLDQRQRELILKRYQDAQPLTAEEKVILQGDVDSLKEMLLDPDTKRNEFLEEYYETDIALTAVGSDARYLRDQLNSLSPRQFDKHRESQLKRKMDADSKMLGTLLNPESNHQDHLKLELTEHMRRWRIENPDATPSDARIEATKENTKIQRDSLLPSGKNDYPRRFRSHPSLGPQGNFRTFKGSRDQISNFHSRPGKRYVALDFNADPKEQARGIEVVVPRNASSDEIERAKDWVQKTHAFFKSHGVDVPIRQDSDGDGVKDGVKIGGGKKGVIHTEPFFANDTEAREVIQNNGAEYGRILGSTLGQIAGVTFIAPHTRIGAADSNPGEGAVSGGFSEREFAMKFILPHLEGSRKTPRKIDDAKTQKALREFRKASGEPDSPSLLEMITKK